MSGQICEWKPNRRAAGSPHDSRTPGDANETLAIPVLRRRRSRRGAEPGELQFESPSAGNHRRSPGLDGGLFGWDASAVLRPQHPAGFDGAPRLQGGGPIGADPVAPDTAAEALEDHFFVALGLQPEEDAEFIRQLFLLNRFM